MVEIFCLHGLRESDRNTDDLSIVWSLNCTIKCDKYSLRITETKNLKTFKKVVDKEKKL